MKLVLIAKYIRVIAVAVLIFTVGYWVGFSQNCDRLIGVMYSQFAENLSSRIELQRIIAFLMVNKQQVNSLVQSIIPLLGVILYFVRKRNP